MARHAAPAATAERLARAPRNITEEAQSHSKVARGYEPHARNPEAGTPYENSAGSPVSRSATAGVNVLEPARALTNITVVDASSTPSNIVRRSIEAGQTIDECYLEGLAEGKHYTRDKTVASKKEARKAVTFAGKAARTALVCIDAVDPTTNLRRKFQRGEAVPSDQLGGLREGVHFE